MQWCISWVSKIVLYLGLSYKYLLIIVDCNMYLGELDNLSADPSGRAV